MEKETINRLWYMRNWCMDFELFKKVYLRERENPDSEHSLASHMWRKFSIEYHNDFLSFWRANDRENQRALIKYLNSDEFEKRFKQNMFF